MVWTVTEGPQREAAAYDEKVVGSLTYIDNLLDHSTTRPLDHSTTRPLDHSRAVAYEISNQSIRK